MTAAANRPQLLFASGAIGGTIAIANPIVTGKVSTQTEMLILVAALLMLTVIGNGRRVISLGDRNQVPLQTSRVHTAQAFAALLGAALAATHGDAGFRVSLPIWAAMVGVGLTRVWQAITSAIWPRHA